MSELTTFTISQDDITEEICLLVEDYVLMYTQINLRLHPVIYSPYKEFCKRELRKLTSQLTELGYAIVIS